MTLSSVMADVSPKRHPDRRAPAAPAPARTWISVAPHLQPRHVGDRAPWGVVHAGLSGSTKTACGLPRTTWFVFWHLPFDGRKPEACRPCAHRLAELSRRDAD
ncbi:hypothetical protein [Nocardioides sp. W7]|uniref:hypothetical protein n=1 Tax=Nocardioides sp. W7 TaxID=2931390 RepID=UPI001FD0D69C|nr:hypothetical protein [Nocardioides sp. W7]